MSLYLKFEEYPISACWDIQIFIFSGHVPLEVVFYWRSSSMKPFFTLVWSHELMFKIWGRSDQWLLRSNPWSRRGWVGGWVAGWLAGQVRFYSPLRPSYRSDFSSGPSVAITAIIPTFIIIYFHYYTLTMRTVDHREGSRGNLFLSYSVSLWFYFFYPYCF